MARMIAAAPIPLPSDIQPAANRAQAVKKKMRAKVYPTLAFLANTGLLILTHMYSLSRPSGFTPTILLPSFQCPPDFRRRLPKVEHSPHDRRLLILNSVINRVRKPLRQEAMISENLPVHASKGNEGIDFREETVEKIRAKSFALALVKILCSVEIFQG